MRETRIWPLWLAAPMLLPACSDDDGRNAEDRWNANYAYIQRTTFLQEGDMTFSARHTPMGVSVGDTMAFYARLTRPSESAVTVRLAVSGSERLPATAYRLLDKSGAELSVPELTIAAGQTVSDTVRLALADVAPLAANDDALTTTGEVAIDAVETAATNTRVAESRALRQIGFNVAKGAIQYVAQEESAPTGALRETLSPTQLEVEGTNRWGGGVENLLDGSDRTYMMLYYSEKSIQVDLGSAKRVAAVALRFYSTDTAPSRVRVSAGDAPGTLDTLADISTTGARQNLTIYSQPAARYVRIDLLETNYYCLMTGVEIYTIDS